MKIILNIVNSGIAKLRYAVCAGLKLDIHQLFKILTGFLRIRFHHFFKCSSLDEFHRDGPAAVRRANSQKLRYGHAGVFHTGVYISLVEHVRLRMGGDKFLDDHIAQKRAIYERYEEGLKDLPVKMNPWDRDESVPNFWLSCMIIDEDAMAPSVRGEQDYLYKQEKGKSSPHEILDAIASINAEGRPIWKPMHMQPIYRAHAFVTAKGNGRGRSNAYIEGKGEDVGADIFRRGLCLPSDNKMTPEQQDRVIEVIKRCFA